MTARTTPAEIAKAIAHAKSEPQHLAVEALYDPEADRIVVVLADGLLLGFPRRRLQGLEDAAPDALADIALEGGGTGLFWPRLDVAHFLPGLLDGFFGTRAWMTNLARRGGSATSSRKTAAVRENGKKGGRPKKAVVKRSKHA